MTLYDLSRFPPRTSEATAHFSLHQFLETLGIKEFNFGFLQDKAQGRLYLPDDRSATRLESHLYAATLQQTFHPQGPQIQLRSGRRTFPIRFRRIENPNALSDWDNLLHESLTFGLDHQTDTVIRNQRKFEFKTNGFTLGYVGYWRYMDRFELYGYHQHRAPAVLILGRTGLRWLPNYLGNPEAFQVDIPYSSISTTIVDQEGNGVVFSLSNSPKIREKSFDRGWLKYNRVSHLGSASTKVLGNCRNYYITFSTRRYLSDLSSKLQGMGIPFVFTPKVNIRMQPQSIESELEALSNAMVPGFPMPLRFQIQKIATNGIWRPMTICEMIPRIAELSRLYDTRMVEDGLLHLYVDNPELHTDTRSDLAFTSKDLIGYLEAYLQKTKEPQFLPKSYPHLAIVYRARITPMSVYLEGPFAEPSNRVLRMYKDSLHSFLRVTISDENAEPLYYSLSDKLVRQFREILVKGIQIYGGPDYQFFGFSNSSLRAQSSWFSCPFRHNGALITYQELYKSLGSFDKIRCPALCASRIGQSFSDTAHAITLGPDYRTQEEDVTNGTFCFSDGCGRISPMLLELVWKKVYPKKEIKPTTLQIRLGGYKGIVTLDPTIDGYGIVLRDSMYKFESTHWALEICASNYRCSAAYLNHQIIKILEDLGVPHASFLQLQERAIKNIMKSMSSLGTAVKTAMITCSPFLRNFFHLCSEKRWQYWEDRTIRQAIQLLCLLALRDIKYRGRIVVDKGAMLFGVMDEYGVLKGGEVIIIIETAAGKRVVRKDQVLITRAPTMAPSDIQFAKAVMIPDGCPLKSLTNCIIFPQTGARDMPSQLSGGDLDGDIYYAFWDDRFIPPRTVELQIAKKGTMKTLSRPVEREDIIDFYLQFMQSDKLGEISTKHKIFADQKLEGTESKICLDLADAASVAVDAGKFGFSVDLSFMKKEEMDLCKFRPDFMQPAVTFDLDPDESIAESMVKGPTRHVLSDAPDFDQVPRKYYKSKRVLGKLYRNVDEYKFLRELEQKLSENTQDDLRATIWNWVVDKAPSFRYGPFLNHARELRAQFQCDISQLCHQYSPSTITPISELELITGNILGLASQGGVHRIRDMVEALRKSLAYTIHRYESWIKFISRETADKAVPGFEFDGGDLADDGHYDAGEVNDEDEEDDAVEYVRRGGRATTVPKTATEKETLRSSLPFAIACLYIATFEDGEAMPKLGKIKSFWIFAAQVCVKMVDEYCRSVESPGLESAQGVSASASSPPEANMEGTPQKVEVPVAVRSEDQVVIDPEQFFKQGEEEELKDVKTLEQWLRGLGL